MPTITHIKFRKGRPERMLVTVDDEQEFLMTPETVLKHLIAVGKSFDDDTFLEILEEDSYLRAKDQAMRYLALRPHSAAEIRKKLFQKGYRSAQVERVLESLQQVGLLNDRDFARAYVENELNLRPVGALMLRQKLMARGVARHIIDEVLEEFTSEESELAIAAKLAEKQMRLLKRFPPEKQRQKLIQHLRQKGLGWEAIRHALTVVNITPDDD